MNNRDANLNEKEVFVVHGTVMADEFKDRRTGKDIGESSKPYIGSDYIVVDDSESGDEKVISLDADAVEFLIPKEVPLASIDHDPGETDTLITIAPGLFDVDNGYELLVEIEGSGVHYGFVAHVFPYNGSEAIVTTLLSVNGTTKEVYTSMTSGGQVSITVPFVMTPESQDTKIFYKRVI